MPSFFAQPRNRRGKVTYITMNERPVPDEIHIRSESGQNLSTKDSGVNVVSLLNNGILPRDKVHWTTKQNEDGSTSMAQLSCDRIDYPLLGSQNSTPQSPQAAKSVDRWNSAGSGSGSGQGRSGSSAGQGNAGSTGSESAGGQVSSPASSVKWPDWV